MFFTHGIIILFLVIFCCSVCFSAALPLDKPNMAIKVEAGEYVVQGQKVIVAQMTGLSIAPPEIEKVKHEEQVISDEPSQGWCGGTQLAKTLGPVDAFCRYPKRINPTSVNVYLADPTGTPCKEGQDYILDHVWGAVTRVESGAIPKGAKILIDYSVYLQRVDIVQVNRVGEVTIKQGKSSVTNCEIPQADSGYVALASIWVPFRAKAITKDYIFNLPAEKITWQDFIRVDEQENLKNTLSLLKNKKPINIVCWGDSVTEGSSPSSRDKCYVELFRSRLKAAYPDTPITLTNAGIGGSNTDSRRDGFEKEVLALNPDLITWEYVNDVGKTPEKIKANYAEFTAKAREKNPKVEFIIITPHYTLSDWMSNFEKSVPAMRVAAEDNKAALADAANIWANLYKVGIPYETLLANGINHPNDLGHEFFTACLMELLAPKK